MKLRIKGSSIRLRVTEPEVRALANSGSLEETVRFPDGVNWKYRLERTTAGAIGASLKNSVLVVGVPAVEIAAWASSDRVGMDASLPLPGGDVMKILIEKDFECLHPRDGETNVGAYAHPAKGPGR